MPNGTRKIPVSFKMQSTGTYIHGANLKPEGKDDPLHRAELGFTLSM